MYFKKAVCEDVYWIYLPYTAFQLWTVMNAVRNELHERNNFLKTEKGLCCR
jgi:hypothetical protein